MDMPKVTVEMLESLGVCTVCGGWKEITTPEGMIPCPKCRMENAMRDIDEDVLKDRQTKIKIPDAFLDIRFEPNKLLKSPFIADEVKKNEWFIQYVRIMNDIYEKFCVGVKLTRNVMIAGDQGSGKNSFVYSCINGALRNGKTVAPYYDTGDIYNFIRFNAKQASSEATVDSSGKTRVVYNDYNAILDTLYSSDVCFVKFQVGLTSNRDTQALKVLTDRRARNNLPTVLISRVGAFYLYKIEENLKSSLLKRSEEIPLYDYSKYLVIEAPRLFTYGNKKTDDKPPSY